jgi:hypothetical protein
MPVDDLTEGWDGINAAVQPEIHAHLFEDPDFPVYLPVNAPGAAARRIPGRDPAERTAGGPFCLEHAAFAAEQGEVVGG